MTVVNRPIALQGITARTIFDANARELKLTWLAGHEGADRSFRDEIVDLASSSADLVGHVNLIHPSRIQVVGIAEDTYYNKISPEQRNTEFSGLVSVDSPFLVVADKLTPHPDLLLRCQRSSTPLFTTSLLSAAVIDHLRSYLTRIGAPKEALHGIFLDILGMGVLIIGESGLGKSELGLELISRGHGLVADDVVDFTCYGPDFIEGRCPTLLLNLLEVRGLGLLDIRAIFGETAVRRKMKLKLVVQLVHRNEPGLERLPIDPQTMNVVGQPVNMVKLQVAAGRNLAVLVEAAVRNTILRLRGIDTLKEFMERQRNQMKSEADASLPRLRK